MKNMKYNVTFVIAFVCTVLFTACDNFYMPPETTESGYGKISIRFAGEEAAQQQNARTVFPSTVFNKYVYTFIKTGETTGEELSPDNDGYFTLEVGNYTVEVQAFNGNEGSYALAANGVSSEFSVGPDNNNPVVVFLTEVDTGAQGIFSYTITYPVGADAVITMKKWLDLSDITLTPANLTEGDGVTETLGLDSGFYLLTILISKDGLYAGISEVVHIYPETVTEYTKEFDDEDLIAEISITVNDYYINGTGTFTYDGDAKTVSITPKETASPGAITVFYNGTETPPVDIGTYTVTFNVEAVRGWSEANGLPAGTIIITRAAGVAISAPSGTSSVTGTSITINAVPAPENGQTVEYAMNTTDSAPSSGWQDSTTFSGLIAGTTYYFFARSAQNTIYDAGEASSGLQVITPIPLSAGNWTDGSIISTASVVSYSFNVVSGATYYIWWNDSKEGNDTKSLDVKVSANYNGGTSIFTDIDSGWTNPQSFTADTDGTVNVCVNSYSNGGAGTFAIVYNTNNTRPAFYTVTFSANGGSGTVPTALTVSTGSSVRLPSGSGLTRNGYTFGGWNTNSSGTGTNYSAGASYTPTGNITLYARWYYTVTYNINGGYGVYTAEAIVNPGSSITLQNGSGLTRTGYTFNGWNTEASGTGTNYNAGASYTPTSNITLYARWVVIYYTVTFNRNGGSGTVPSAQTVAFGTNITIPGRSGLDNGLYYAFTGWNTKINGTGTNYNPGETYTVTGDITLYARWSDGSRANPWPLTENTWVEGSIVSLRPYERGDSIWYMFNVTGGTTYYVWWNDSYDGDSTKTLDVDVGVVDINGVRPDDYHDNVSGWTIPLSLTANNTTETLYICVSDNSILGGSGTFGIAYSTNDTRP